MSNSFEKPPESQPFVDIDARKKETMQRAMKGNPKPVDYNQLRPLKNQGEKPGPIESFDRKLWDQAAREKMMKGGMRSAREIYDELVAKQKQAQEQTNESKP